MNKLFILGVLAVILLVPTTSFAMPVKAGTAHETEVRTVLKKVIRPTIKTKLKVKTDIKSIPKVRTGAGASASA